MTSSLLVMRLKIDSQREKTISKDEFHAFYMKKKNGPYATEKDDGLESAIVSI